MFFIVDTGNVSNDNLSWGWLSGAFVSNQTLLILEVVIRNTRVCEIAYGFGGPTPSEKNVSPH